MKNGTGVVKRTELLKTEKMKGRSQTSTVLCIRHWTLDVGRETT